MYVKKYMQREMDKVFKSKVEKSFRIVTFYSKTISFHIE